MWMSEVALDKVARKKRVTGVREKIHARVCAVENVVHACGGPPIITVAALIGGARQCSEVKRSKLCSSPARQMSRAPLVVEMEGGDSAKSCPNVHAANVCLRPRSPICRSIFCGSVVAVVREEAERRYGSGCRRRVRTAVFTGVSALEQVILPYAGACTMARGRLSLQQKSMRVAAKANNHTVPTSMFLRHGVMMAERKPYADAQELIRASTIAIARGLKIRALGCAVSYIKMRSAAEA